MTGSHHCLHDHDMLTDDEGDVYSEESVCQSYQSQIKSNNPPSPVSCHESVSLQSIDYCDLSTVVNERAERLVTVPGVTYNPFTLRRELAKMFILHEYPLSMSDHIGFRDFLHNLNPVYGMVSQSSIENDIMSIFKIERCKIFVELNSDDMPCGRVAITTKMWTSSDCSRRFLAISGHFVHHEWKKRSFIMRFANVPLPCTNESISKIIQDCISYFEVENKLFTITVDSDTSDDELMDILMDKLSINKPLFRGKLFRLPCFAHTMSRMVQEGFKVIGHVIKKIQDSIVFWTSSPEREMAIEKAACELGIKTTTKLVLDDGLSWSSTYLMLQESIKFKDVFSHLGKYESQYDFFPSMEEWDLAREVCNRLQWLYNCMMMLAKGPVACLYVFVICQIKLKLLDWLNFEVPEIKVMASNMVEKLDKYWLVARDILGVAAIFHPSFKFTPLERYFSKIYGNEAESEVERIRQIFYDLFKEYESSLPLDETEKEVSQKPHSYMDCWIEMALKEMWEEERKQGEVNLYLKQSVGPITDDSSILSWWKEHKTSFPILYTMAKDFLAIPIFSVDAENAFDVGNRILGANRSCIHPSLVEALMCTQKWVKGQKQHLDSEVSSSASNMHTLGTIHDDAHVEHGIIFKAKSGKSAGDITGEETNRPIE